MIHDPDILILDEPMSGLDPLGRRLVTRLILDFKERGKTVFFSSHILNDVETLCDRIAILDKGKRLFYGNIEEFCQGSGSMEDAFVERITNSGY
jgi:ABC-2 type transport system ATP-binding protein